MKSAEPIANPMEEKRQALLDNCTRALCGDTTLDSKVMDEATGGRYSKQKSGDEVDHEQIKTLILALRWLGLQPEPVVKTRKRRAANKASADNGSRPVVKRRGRPKGSKNKSTIAKEKARVTESQTVKPPVEKPKDEAPAGVQPPVQITPPSDLKDITFEGGGLPQ